MGKGSGGGTNTVTNNSSPPPEVMEQYRNLISQGNQVAGGPLNQYGGPMIAGFTPDQTAAMNTVNNSQGISAPYINQAQGMINSSQTPLWNSTQQWSPDAIQKYMNPYQQDVTNATMANINETNAQQNQQVVGDAISKGAWGGDRAGIAQSEMARQQALASNQTLAGLNSQNYTQATNQFNQQQGAQLGANTTNNWLASQGAFGEANLGTTAQSNALQGAAAQLATGQQQQTLAQSALNIPYEQFLQQQAYPYQNLSWLSGISTGLGSGMGGTSSSTQPSPNGTSQMLGNLGSIGQLGYLGYLAYTSDRRVKEDIERVGMHKGNYGFYPTYNFKYKGDDKRYHGVMAQDVEKINPDAVGHDKRGIKFVDYGKLARGGVARGFTPNNYDIGGGVPSIDLSYIPTVGMTKGSSIPNAPQLNHSQSGGPDASTSVGMIANLMKMDKGGKDMTNPLGLSAGSNFNNGDLSKLAGDFESAGGGFDLGSFGMNRGGSAPRHYDMGGNVGMSPPMMPGMMPRGTTLQPTQLQGYADGGAPDDPYDNILDSVQPAATGIAPPPPPQAVNQAPMTRGIAPEAPKFDGAYATPINKPDAIMSLLGGLSAMGASQSPFFSVNAAHGASEGMKNYEEQKKQAAQESYQQGTLKQQGESLYDKAQMERGKMFEDSQHNQASESQAQKTLAETSKYHRDEIALAREKMDQDSVTMVPDGMGGFLQYNKKDMNDFRTISGPGVAADPAGPDGKPLTGQAYIDAVAKSNPRMADFAKKIGDGDMQFPTAYALSKSPALAGALDAAIKYNPDINGRVFGNIQKFDTGPEGKLTRSFNVVANHMAVLEEAANALDNGDMRALNQLKNTWKEQFGSEIPTNVNTAKKLVSAEIVKAITGAGGVADRQDVQEAFSNAASGDQWKGSLGIAKHLVSGQLGGLDQQYKATTGQKNYKDKYLSPETKKFLGLDTPVAPKMVKVTSPDGTQTGTMSAAEAEMATKNGWKVIP